jgi:hypothetical protein
MRKVLILVLGLSLVCISSSFAQTLMDYVKEVRGDVLVVKDFTDMGQVAGSINNVVISDSVNVPAGRVYELQANGWYPQTAGLTTPSNRPIVFAGAVNTILVNNKDITAAPPIISGYSVEGGASSTGGITWGNNFTMKNTSTVVGAPDGTIGWAFYGPGAANLSSVFENCMMETNWWVFIQSNAWAGSKLYFKDCYFVNMSGRACRRNGGVYDNVNNPTDTMWIENCTHVMGQGSVYKFRNYEVPFIFVNHNTFINCAGTLLETQGYQSNVIVTNNIFVNSNEQPFRPNMTEDLSEQDAGQLPTGLIDVAPLPSTMNQLDRKFLVQNNVAYWDSRLANLGPEANDIPVNGFSNWVNQSIKMNDRTQAMFNDNTTYPYLTEGVWYDKLPAFTNTADLLTGQVDEVKAFCLATVDTTSTSILPAWRVTSVGPANFIYSDFPIPIDLSYSDPDLKVGGTDGLPVGDLNWFQDKKATYNDNKATYVAALVDGLSKGHVVTVGVQELGGVVTDYKLGQNYPNPFNPTTMISFSIPKAGNVTLKVYDQLGKEITTLVNGYKTAQTYEVQFDASKLSSGVYFYTLHTDSFDLTKKMILMK